MKIKFNQFRTFCEETQSFLKDYKLQEMYDTEELHLIVNNGKLDFTTNINTALEEHTYIDSVIINYNDVQSVDKFANKVYPHIISVIE